MDETPPQSEPEFKPPTSNIAAVALDEEDASSIHLCNQIMRSKSYTGVYIAPSHFNLKEVIENPYNPLVFLFPGINSEELNEDLKRQPFLRKFPDPLEEKNPLPEIFQYIFQNDCYALLKRELENFEREK
tara:strand:+ start:237 stop:626 length:390 start_codon:yes stop_codon:yes gene_type:complete